MIREILESLLETLGISTQNHVIYELPQCDMFCQFLHENFKLNLKILILNSN